MKLLGDPKYVFMIVLANNSNSLTRVSTTLEQIDVTRKLGMVCNLSQNQFVWKSLQ